MSLAVSAIKPCRLGILVPSSNTALEPLTTAMLSSLSPQVTVHFTRFAVTKISLDPAALAQFDTNGPILAAAKLLADAHVDIIGWSGTSAGWLGFDTDERLCAAITEATGIPATTSTLAMNRLLDRLGVKRFALVTPYLDDVQERILATYAAAGYQVVAESHLRRSDNVNFVEIDEGTLNSQVAEVINKGDDEVQAISTFCTNLRAAQRVAEWESQYGVPVLDTVATVVWDMLRMTGVEMKSIKGWGKIFDLGGTTDNRPSRSNYM